MRQLGPYNRTMGWGDVLANANDRNVAPTDITGADTQATQAENSATVAAMQTTQLPPPPIISEMVDKDGKVSRMWNMWFQRLWSSRVGGAVSQQINADGMLYDAYDAVMPPPNLDQFWMDQTIVADADDKRIANLESYDAVRPPPNLDQFWMDQTIGADADDKRIANLESLVASIPAQTPPLLFVPIKKSGDTGIGALAISNTTDASSLIVASLVTSGGLAVAKKSYHGNLIIVPKTAGMGIKVDTSAPTYPWRDLVGEIHIRTAGATVPTYAVWQGGIYAVSFDNATLVQEVFNTFHMPHDYAMATDLWIHAHWSVITAATGNVDWLFDLSYGKGYNQAAIEGTVGTSLPVTVGITQAGGGAFYHQIAEVQCSAAGGLIAPIVANISITSGSTTLTAASSAFGSQYVGRTVTILGAGAGGSDLKTKISAYTSTTQVTLADAAGTTVTAQPNFRLRVLDSSLFEPDGLIICRTWHQTNRTSDTLTQIPFLHFVDCHYQSTGIGTKQKTGPNFWT